MPNWCSNLIAFYQEDGGNCLLTINYLASIELGSVEVNDRTVKVICAEFKVDEHWLRTGEGEPYREDIYVIRANCILNP